MPPDADTVYLAFGNVVLATADADASNIADFKRIVALWNSDPAAELARLRAQNDELFERWGRNVERLGEATLKINSLLAAVEQLSLAAQFAEAQMTRIENGQALGSTFGTALDTLRQALRNAKPL